MKLRALELHTCILLSVLAAQTVETEVAGTTPKRLKSQKSASLPPGGIVNNEPLRTSRPRMLCIQLSLQCRRLGIFLLSLLTWHATIAVRNTTRLLVSPFILLKIRRWCKVALGSDLLTVKKEHNRQWD